MRIIGPGAVVGTQNTARKTTKKVGDGSFFSLIEGADEASGTHESSPIKATGMIGTLLALQELESSNEKPIKRGKSLLDALDKIRMGLLTGHVSESNMRSLREEIMRDRDKVTDPALRDILEEIDVRAAVELAKLEKAKARL